MVAILISLPPFHCPGDSTQSDCTEVFQQVAYLRRQSVGLSLNSKPGRPVHRIHNLQAWWPSCTPMHWVHISVAFYDLHGLQWDLLFSEIVTRKWTHGVKGQFHTRAVLSERDLYLLRRFLLCTKQSDRQSWIL